MSRNRRSSFLASAAVVVLALAASGGGSYAYGSTIAHAPTKAKTGTVRVAKTKLGAHGAAEGIGGALCIDAVLLELVHQVGAGGRPGEPSHVAPPRYHAVGTQCIGRQQDKQQPRRTEADPRPDKGESKHPRRG